MNYFKDVMILWFIGLSTVAGDTSSNILSGPTHSLRSTLKKFSKPRHHLSSPSEKHKARRFIKRAFRQFGLHVWCEHVGKPRTRLRGENIVGMLKGKKTGTADDKMVIVGAHYDTIGETKGVDDNGSGVTALLEVAKQIGKARCQMQNTIMFVAFDFEEDTIQSDYLIPLGSQLFVKNLTRHLNKTGGTVKGALILEMLANHNTTKDSQLFPRRFPFVFPEAYNEVRRNGKRGNFLAVIGRKSDELLMLLIKKYYRNGTNYRAQLVPIPLSGRPSQSSHHRYFRDFYRSDHYNFWENTVLFPAVMLTDTSNFRRNMDRCYHKKCDNMRQIQKNDLEFLRRNINAVIQTTLELSKADCGHSTDQAKSFILVSTKAMSTAAASHAVKSKELKSQTAPTVTWNLTLLILTGITTLTLY